MKYGKVLSCKVVLDPHTQESRGFAFVRMEKKENADEAISQLNQRLEMEGRILTVERVSKAMQ